MSKQKRTIIIGCGPAGMFAADVIAGNGEVVVIDQGKPAGKRRCTINGTSASKHKCAHCEYCNIMCGVGGAGLLSDGLLNLNPFIGGDLTLQTGGDNTLAWQLVDDVDKTFLRFGAPINISTPNTDSLELLDLRCSSYDVKFINIIQRHMGSDNAPRIIENFYKDLVARGVKFRLETKVVDLMIESGVCNGVILEGGERIEADAVILAPGRIGAPLTGAMIDKYRISSRHTGIDIGVRVEVPATIMKRIIEINRDPKFHIRTPGYDDRVRTFCTNHRGYVVAERYDTFVGVNGHSMTNQDEQSSNTNFAFLVHVDLTEPTENTTQYGESIAMMATTIGGQKPVLQRMGDLRRKRRTNKERLENNNVVPTLRDVTLGDISMALPGRILEDIREGLEILNEVIPGVAADSVLLYAPEVKFYAREIKVDLNMETSIKNLYAAGDGAGLSRDIVNAAATGILAGRGVRNRLFQ